MEHFHFIGEFNKATDLYTGLAVSNRLSSGTSLQINAYSNSGSFVDGRAIQIGTSEHRAFFIHELLTLPDGFRGTIEVVANQPIVAAVLRLEKDQLSSVDIDAFIANYDVSISLQGGRNYQAEMSFSISNDEIRGKFRFTNLTPLHGWEESPVAGTVFNGIYQSHIWTVTPDMESILIMLTCLDQRTSVDAINGTVAWNDRSGKVSGTFAAKKRK